MIVTIRCSTCSPWACQVVRALPSMTLGLGDISETGTGTCRTSSSSSAAAASTSGQVNVSTGNGAEAQRLTS